MQHLFKKFFRFIRSRWIRDHPTTPIDDHPDLRNAHQDIPVSPVPLPADNEPSSSPTHVYFDSAEKLKESFPSTCWLKEGDLEFIGADAVISGRYADVWKGHLDGRLIAIKTYRCYVRFDSNGVLMRFSREVDAYSRLSHRNISPFIGVYSTKKHPFCLVFDSFMGRLILADHIRKSPSASKVQLVTGIARGLNHMHDLGIVHGNLESANILVDPDGTPRIAGLGSSSIQSSSSAVWSGGSPILTRCSAPELVNPAPFGLVESETTKPSDIFAFGVLAYEVFTGAVMFPDRLDAAAVYSISIGERPFRPQDPELSDRVWDMINRCWAQTPSQRITITEVVSILETELR